MENLHSVFILGGFILFTDCNGYWWLLATLYGKEIGNFFTGLFKITW
jgi:hypothetical protein